MLFKKTPLELNVPFEGPSGAHARATSYPAPPSDRKSCQSSIAALKAFKQHTTFESEKEEVTLVTHHPRLLILCVCDPGRRRWREHTDSPHRSLRGRRAAPRTRPMSGKTRVCYFYDADIGAQTPGRRPPQSPAPRHTFKRT